MKNKIPELILKKRRYGHYTSALTKIMDDNLIYPYNNVIFSTYIYETKIDNFWLLRFPGGTRGCIKVDENEIIQDISIYEDCNIYTKGLEEKLKDKFLGMKIVTLDYKTE